MRGKVIRGKGDKRKKAGRIVGDVMREAKRRRRRTRKQRKEGEENEER